MESNKQVILFQRDEVALGYKYKLENPLTSDIKILSIDYDLENMLEDENIKILVLDTEVYSNTGGQSSKSTKLGAVAEFANFGKRTIKKDLFKIASCIPNCYVASISLGANMMQAIKAFNCLDRFARR
jgi:pyruvate-ferredoxin/flavodoxin oxidoreductase